MGKRTDLKRAAVARIGGGVISALMASCRYRLVAGEAVEESIVRPGAPAIYVLWHGRLLPCAYHYRHLGLGTLISRNRDGEYITGMIERWGFQVIRGSTSRGAAGAQRAIVRALGAGNSIALTPDGPRGPRRKMKTGPVRAAAKAGVPIVPVSAGAERAWYFGSWDRFLVPRPFTPIAVALGDPVRIPVDAGPDEIRRTATELEDRLNVLTRLTDEAVRGGR